MTGLASAAGRLDISIVPAGDLPSLEAMWRALEETSEASFFQSWCWIGTWLEALPDADLPEILAARADGRTVALGLLGARTTRRHAVLRSRGLFLNAAGAERFDALTIEYNGFLVDRDREAETLPAIFDFLVARKPGWDELFLYGVAGPYGKLAEAAGLSVHCLYSKECRFVDLTTLGGDGDRYLAGLSRNTRYQINRAIRRYESRGALEFRVAANVSEALDFLEGWKAFHQAYWISRGEPGSFANPFFERFHRRLIERYADSGEVEIIRISVAGEAIGYLYNFVWRGRVYSYQSGFAYEEDNAVKPGLVSHYLAIRDYAARGLACYDFMAGESQHKSSLGPETLQLDWLSARRPCLKYRIEDALRQAKHLALRARPAAGAK